MVATRAKPVSLEDRLNFIDMDNAAREKLRELKPTLEKHLGPALNNFYDKVRKVQIVVLIGQQEAAIAVLLTPEAKFRRRDLVDCARGRRLDFHCLLEALDVPQYCSTHDQQRCDNRGETQSKFP